MNAFDGLIDNLNKADFDFIENNLKDIVDLNKVVSRYVARVNESIQEYQRTGESDISNLLISDDCESGNQSQGTSTESRSSKENIQPVQTNLKKEPPSLTKRTRRNAAFKEILQNVKIERDLSLSLTLRRPEGVQGTFQNAYVKVERMSLDNTEWSMSNDVEKMPAPTQSAPRTKKNTQIKQAEIDEQVENDNRDSDVIMEDVTVTIVNIVNKDEGEKKQEQERNTRTNRKVKKRKTTRTESPGDEEWGSNKKRSKSNQEEITEMHYGDAVLVLGQNQETNNITRILKSQVNENLEATQNVNANETNNATNATCNMNATVIVDSPKDIVTVTAENLMTDDESKDQVTKKNPPKPIRTVSKPPKEIFSPFEHNPVKKKVAAFEKLKEIEEANAIPARITRTKTKAKVNQQEEPESNEATENAVKSAVKEKAKVFKPLTSKFLPTFTSPAMKQSRTNASNVSSESLLSGKSASALKASQAEYRERENKRIEKEKEAKKKRDALILAQIEESKRKREEKQLKAQQQREAPEKEKLKLKDKRHKQWMAGQEERKQKHKQELEKNILGKIRAIKEKKEEQRIEEKMKVATLAKQNEEMSRMPQKKKSQVPLYLRTEAPLLPTDDCYDSDAEEYRNSDDEPEWASEKILECMQKCQLTAREAVKNTFFSVQAQTPDLQDIFEVITPHKLKRSSSAVWHKPPRCTMIPTLEDHVETDEYFT
ncbi:hypothetical protein GEV33_001504 [Tenebrio molitor]|uniref:Uncharacterized protein n=1 Tax=Tenebrio molitor TaxID=7067 RepID=A0A8J6LJR9_TENMO|nr:hypothetical protein GEV33_001504 [Tenebrio molitor]